MPVRWTEQAADDLAAIRDFIARDSAAYAHAIVERLYSAGGHLREFPDLGRIVPERAQPELRELIRLRYRIVYRHTDKAIEILTIFHSVRAFPESIG
jgi:plasmid stabilization system protein ParE